jgi:hypothetical protein
MVENFLFDSADDLLGSFFVLPISKISADEGGQLRVSYLMIFGYLDEKALPSGQLVRNGT